MRILLANKFFYPRGGAERYFLDLMDLLPEQGHAAAPFSMSHPKNRPSPYARYFVTEVDYAADGGAFGSVAAAARTVYNRETRRRVKALVRSFRPDVAHLHNVHHQLSGSLFEGLHEIGVPIIQTLHDFQWVCPVYTFLRDGRPCELCRRGRTWPAVRHRCQDGSLARSAVAALELKVGEWRHWESMVSSFLAPSEFLARKVIEHGLPETKVELHGYFLRLHRYRPPRGPRGKHALYAGRLSPEKGVSTLLQSLAAVPDLVLRVAGTGPLEPELRRRAERLAPDRIHFLGHLDGDGLRRELGEAAFTVVPSEWYENQPYAILEAFAMETPVLGAAIGGIPELVIPDETGLLFPPGSVAGLAEALRSMGRRDDLRDLGRGGRRLVEERFAPETQVATLTRIYERAAS